MEQSGEIRKKKLTCRGISKSFPSSAGNFEVLQNLTFDVYENEFLVLFGPGQCGKTTLLYIMAGLEECTQGEVFHNGSLVTEPAPSRAVVYQTMALFPWMTVWDNVCFSQKVRNADKKVLAERTQYFIDLVGLTGFEKSFPVQLSGGMKQRVGIARAYASESDILLLDEPFGALDAQTRYQMEDEIIKIWEKNKKTIIFVTNNVEEALYLGDRILLLSSRPAEIKKEYVVDLPRPRSYTDKAFLEYRNEIVDNTDLDI